MAIATDERPPAGGVERGRGGFYRRSDDTPYVSDPSGATVKSGARKGLPKRIAYGSPSGRGKQIENSKALEKWGERRVVLGVGLTPNLATACTELVGLDPDSDEFKAAADRLVVKLKDAAEANLAAERGTHGHAITEDDDEGRDWVERAEAGELLGIPVDAQRAMVHAWRDMLVRDGLEILATEASCVDDRWRLAGTLDNIARLTKPLRFAMLGGEIVEVPAGTVLVLDKKTGRRRLDERTGAVMYWQGYSVQIASYAQSVPYDTEAETRSEWPWPISQDHALIAHLDVLGAIDGNPSCELVYVDLAQGRAAGDACEWAHRVWDAQNTSKSATFSVAQIASAGSVSPADAATEVTAPARATASVAPSPLVDLTPSRPAERTAAVGATPCAPAAAEPSRTTTGDPECTSATPTPASSADALPRTTSSATPTASSTAVGATAPAIPTAPAADTGPAAPAVDRATVVAQLGGPNHTPDEGADLTGDKRWDDLQGTHFLLDDAAKSWFHELITQAAEASLRISAHYDRTERRFHIYRGAITLAEHGADNAEILRGLVALALDSDAPLFPAVTPGHAVGAMDASAARRFAELCERYVADDLGGLRCHVGDDGLLRFVVAA